MSVSTVVAYLPKEKVCLLVLNPQAFHDNRTNAFQMFYCPYKNNCIVYSIKKYAKCLLIRKKEVPLHP